MTETQHHEEETALRSYLLGLASTEEQKRVEERLLTDSEYFNELERVEECLTDEYVRGEIQGIEKEQFDRHFLKSAEHREGLEFARLLDRYFSEQNIARSMSLPLAPRWRAVMEVVLAAAVIVLMGASVLLFRQVSNLREEAAHLQQERNAANERERAVATQLAEQQQAVKEQQQLVSKLQQELANQKKIQEMAIPEHPEIVAVSLTPGLDRTGAQARQVIIPASAQALRLELRLQHIGYSDYRAQVETVEGDVIWSTHGLATGNRLFGLITRVLRAPKKYKAVVLVLPVGLINRSQYLIKLTGTSRVGIAEIIGTYYLNVTRK